MSSIYDKYGIGFDLTFELNEFQKPRIRSEIETVKNTLMYILFSKPGQYPSLPTIGLNIHDMLYSYYDEIDVDELKTRIVEQCEMLGCYFDSGIIGIKKFIYQDKPSLLIHIEGKESYPSNYMKDNRTTSNRYLIGITFDDMNNMIYNMNIETS